MMRAGSVLRADDVLRPYFVEQLRGATPRRADRLGRAHDDLRRCLDELAPLLFSQQELALLVLERQFDADGAAARVASADAVLLMLPVFLDGPRWHGVDVEDRRLRIRLATALTDEVLRLWTVPGRDLGRAAGVVQAVVRHEVWMLRQEREVLRRG